MNPENIIVSSVRVGKLRYYLEIAEAVSKRATCLRRQVGAVIVVNEQVVASGYCGAPRGVKDCLERKSCIRQVMNVPHNERYELCRSVHAEQNAIINAARAGVSIFGGDIYVWGYCRETNKIFNTTPCLMCLKMVVNAGLRHFYYIAPDSLIGAGEIDLSILKVKWSDEEFLKVEINQEE